MKRKIFSTGLMLSLGASITFYSCKKDNVQPQNTLNVAQTSTGSLRSVSYGDLKPENMGDVHNQILGDYLNSNAKLTLSNYKQQTIIVDNFLCNELETMFHKNYYCNISSDLSSQHIIHVSTTVTDDINALSQKFDFHVNRLNSVHVFSDANKAKLSEYRNILFETKSLKELQSKIAIFDGGITDKNTTKIEYELLKSLTSVTSSSAAYWSNFGGNPTPGLPIGDCVGFLAGWGSALWDELSSNGHLSESNSGHRLGAGVIWGAAGSAVSPI
jgi:hypothetical protein